MVWGGACAIGENYAGTVTGFGKFSKRGSAHRVFQRLLDFFRYILDGFSRLRYS
jgi:hypothetical protein